MMVFAATGAGKGIGIVIPTLLDYPGSILVTDPKGENYAITAAYRRQVGTVRMMNPADLVLSDRWNPMDIIRAKTGLEADDAKALAKLMIKPDAREAHWDDKAASLLTALILHTLRAPPELRHLGHVRRLSVGGIEAMRDTLEEIVRDGSVAAAEIASGFLGQIPQKPTTKAGEFESVLSNVQKATEPWSSGSAAGQLSRRSTFALSDLVSEVTTLFLCVDEELLPVYDRWLRVMTGCVIAQIMRSKHQPRRYPKVLLLLDEVAVLGPLESLERQAGLLRAYCTPVLIWQAEGQRARKMGIKHLQPSQGLTGVKRIEIVHAVNRFRSRTASRRRTGMTECDNCAS
ncbi:type IV secretory system conjugative DNA transfer family protein [Ancylobacter sp.]|uniref:type IV secretory system conjugative DNA transfer family protein n=1 Tax=Ancylobacter sp. TaxID=1872567 RepID=UPI003D1139C0